MHEAERHTGGHYRCQLVIFGLFTVLWSSLDGSGSFWRFFLLIWGMKVSSSEPEEGTQVLAPSEGASKLGSAAGLLLLALVPFVRRFRAAQTVMIALASAFAAFRIDSIISIQLYKVYQ